MSTRQQQKIFATFAALEEAQPNASTERLIMMTAEQCAVDIDDAVDAIYAVGKENGLVRE